MPTATSTVIYIYIYMKITTGIKFKNLQERLCAQEAEKILRKTVDDVKKNCESNKDLEKSIH